DHQRAGEAARHLLALLLGRCPAGHRHRLTGRARLAALLAPRPHGANAVLAGLFLLRLLAICLLVLLRLCAADLTVHDGQHTRTPRRLEMDARSSRVRREARAPTC